MFKSDQNYLRDVHYQKRKDITYKMYLEVMNECDFEV